MKTNFPINGELFVWFLFTGIQLDCLFFMTHHQHYVVGWETRFHGIPSLSDSGVALVREALTQLLEGGTGWTPFSGSHGGQTQHLRGHVSKLPVPRCGDQKWRLWRLRSSVFSVPCASLISLHGTCPQFSALR